MTVIEHLEAIKRLQSDEQRELRAKAMASREGHDVLHSPPAPHFVAQLIEYKRAA